MSVEAIIYTVDWPKLEAQVRARGLSVLDPDSDAFLADVDIAPGPPELSPQLLRVMMAASATLSAMAAVDPAHAGLRRVRRFVDCVFMCRPHPGLNEFGQRRTIAFGPERAGELVAGLEEGDLAALRPLHDAARASGAPDVLATFEELARYLEAFVALARRAQAQGRGVVEFCA